MFNKRLKYTYNRNILVSLFVTILRYFFLAKVEDRLLKSESAFLKHLMVNASSLFEQGIAYEDSL